MSQQVDKMKEIVERLKNINYDKTDLPEVCNYADDVIAVAKVARAKLDFVLDHYRKKYPVEEEGEGNNANISSDQAGTSGEQSSA